MRKNLDHINDLESLDKEIARLRTRVKNIEQTFEENLTDLKENYGSMAMNSIFGRKKPTGQSFWYALTASILESDRVQDGIGHLLGKMKEAVASLVDRFFRK